MRLGALIALVLSLSATVAAGADQAPDAGRTVMVSRSSGTSLLVEDGRGTVQVAGKGVLIGHMDKGWLEIVDLSSTDQWSPRVNGIPRGKTVTLRGKDANFVVPGGRYKLTAKGTGISISARGSGSIVLDGDPDPVNDTGTYAIGDGPTTPLPAVTTKLAFGPPDSAPASS
jgi:hypothetical protein